MSITDISRQFNDEAHGAVVLKECTMSYGQGGAIQVFKFRVVRPNGGEATTIEVECGGYEEMAPAVSKAVEKAIAWAGEANA